MGEKERERRTEERFGRVMRVDKYIQNVKKTEGDQSTN